MNRAAKVYEDEDLIARNSDSFSLIHSNQHTNGNILTGSADVFVGMGTIWKYKAAKNTDVTITYQLNVSSGKAKLVLISPDGRTATLAECTSDSKSMLESTDAINIQKGVSRIKIIGAQDTKLEYKISIDKGILHSF